ncbi:hypothetical protein DV735_g5885, partial [Chaetothyriales sp. CBS 134920]
MSTPNQSDGADDDHSEVMEDHSDIEDDVAGDAAADQNSGQNGDQAAEPAEPTAYSLFSNPPDLAQMRQRLFAVPESIELSVADFEQYFPFVDNVWRKTKLGVDELAPGSNTELYWCRLRKAPGLKPQPPKPVPEGKMRRRKREKPDKTCNMAIKVVYTDGPDKKVVISRTVSKEEEHTHDLDYIDSIKRNGAIMDVARREAVRSFLPLSIFWKMQQEPDKMEEAGGKFMKVSDVRNVQYSWRQENPTVPLKAHTGFNPQRAGLVGRGPGRKSSPQQRRDSSATAPVAMAQPPPPQTPQQPPWTPRPLSTPQPKPHSLQPSLQPSSAPPLQPSSAPPLQPSSAPPLQPSSAPPMTQPFQPHQQQAPPPPPYQTHAQFGPPPTPLPQAANTLQYPDHARAFLAPYLPDPRVIQARQRPHVTLTYAASLDGRIAILPQHRTPLSGPESKSMTHYLRSTHSAILIGVRTAIADNPALNCRLAGAAGYGAPPHSGIMQPRPIILDPNARLHIHPKMEMLKAVCEGRALGPWVIVSPSAQLHPTAVSTLKAHRGEYLQIHDYNPHTGGFSWDGIFNVLYREGIQSIMIEGGAYILSGLLRPSCAHLIDSVITTISAQYLGQQGLQVSPPTSLDDHGRIVPALLKEIRWQPIGDADVVMCGRLLEPPPLPAQLQGPPQPQPQPHQLQPQQQPQQQQQQQPLPQRHTFPVAQKEIPGPQDPPPQHQSQQQQQQQQHPQAPTPHQHQHQQPQHLQQQTPSRPPPPPQQQQQQQHHPPSAAGDRPGSASAVKQGYDDVKNTTGGLTPSVAQTNGQPSADHGQNHPHPAVSASGTPEPKRRKTDSSP